MHPVYLENAAAAADDLLLQKEINDKDYNEQVYNKSFVKE